jgi:excisionase family DNA binding protein
MKASDVQASRDLLSIDRVAAELGLHVRTVRRYVREGRLPAVRIGKQYRVARQAVDALTGRTPEAVAVAVTASAGERHVEVSSIVDVEGIDKDAADRITIGLLAAAKGRPDTPQPLRIDTVYDPARARLKIFLSGSVATTASLLKFVNAYLET